MHATIILDWAMGPNTVPTNDFRVGVIMRKLQLLSTNERRERALQCQNDQIRRDKCSSRRSINQSALAAIKLGVVDVQYDANGTRPGRKDGLTYSCVNRVSRRWRERQQDWELKFSSFHSYVALLWWHWRLLTCAPPGGILGG